MYALDGLYPVYHLQFHLPSPRNAELMVVFIDAITPDYIVSNLTNRIFSFDETKCIVSFVNLYKSIS